MSPTLDLAMIVKNEKKNLPRLLASFAGCLDGLHITDTGSTDGTVEWLREHGEGIVKCPVYIHSFVWVNSFCKARNYAFSHCTSDYILWCDGDDVLSNREGFMHWKKNNMQYAQAWFATYNYALNKAGEPIVAFARERIFKRSLNPVWRYDLHEGIIPGPGWHCEQVPTKVWAVNHMRDMDDIKADKSRNIKILESKRHELDARLQFYYGKELYEAERPHEAIPEFERAMLMPDLEHHDRILTYQYAAYACQQCGDKLKDELKEERDRYYNRAVSFAFEGIKLDSNRAEFYVLIGDVSLRKNDLLSAIPMYSSAKYCVNRGSTGSPYEGAIYSFVDCYGRLPSIQLAKIYFHLGRTEDAEKEASECYSKFQDEEAKKILEEIRRIKPLITIDNNQQETEDIVFTCPPQSAYTFDEEIYKTKGMGGSETALIEMAKNLKKLTGRTVKVFNMREDDLIAESGVEYVSSKKTNQYFSQFKPKTHIAWRHNIEITRAKTYLWCHDLYTPGVEVKKSFTKMLCLSDFHKNYVMGKQGLSENDIIVTRNGLTPSKFKFTHKRKNPNKVVFMSSPDRGLGRCIKICDELIKSVPKLELHVYYGIENLYKYGLADLGDELKVMMEARPYVHYHGFTEQNKMYQEVSDAVLWLHPATFIETFCMTAMEMPALNIYPVTNSLGALQNTLAECKDKGWATLLDSDLVSQRDSCSISDEKIKEYADAAYAAIFREKWMDINYDIDKHSWESIAKEWVQFMEL